MTAMKKSKFTEEQIAYALRQVESGTPPADVCRQLGVSEATFYIWKKKYARLGVAELRKLRSLEEENSRLKRLVADLSLDKHMLTEALRKRSKAAIVHGAEGSARIEARSQSRPGKRRGHRRRPSADDRLFVRGASDCSVTDWSCSDLSACRSSTR
jgi:putative transposase